MTKYQIKDKEGNVVDKIDSKTPEGQELEKTIQHAQALENFISKKNETPTNIFNPASWLFFNPNGKAKAK
jgi:hypothetical protein